jgi:two-component system, chemotaxis family, protein-glutamate methylesterase/glutaminase
MAEGFNGRDIVVVGASAGGLDVLIKLASGLPADFAAALFVVLHLPPDAPSRLATILNRAGPLPALQVEQQQQVQPGRIYVARPDRHLVVHDGHVAVDAGPRENGARPAIDVLFRTAARSYGPRVIGVVLSGTLHDGALGLAAIKLRAGVTVVQDPEEALFAGMPRSALRAAQVDYCLRAADIPRRLVELTQHTREGTPWLAANALQEEDPSRRLIASEHVS